MQGGDLLGKLVVNSKPWDGLSSFSSARAGEHMSDRRRLIVPSMNSGESTEFATLQEATAGKSGEKTVSTSPLGHGRSLVSARYCSGGTWNAYVSLNAR
jgi:hypothetical protein